MLSFMDVVIRTLNMKGDLKMLRSGYYHYFAVIKILLSVLKIADSE